MSLTRAGGSPVPFGALVNVVGAEGNAGVVGSEGEVYLTGLPASGELRVRWKDGQCIATYVLPDSAGVTGVHNLKASCR
ncbi:FimD/PapC C-terminal domain-containing protein [Enterobacter asburiae]